MRRQATIWVTAALFILGLSINVDASEADTCSELAEFGSNQTASTSGEWGTITFDSSSSLLELVVAEGWEVRICVKAGSAQQGDGPEDLGWFSVGEFSLTHSTGKNLSHFAINVREDPSTTTSTLVPTTTVPGSTSSTSSTTVTVPTTTVPNGSTTFDPTTTFPDDGSTLTIPTTPTTTPNELPFTGVPVAPLAGTGVGLLTLGSLLVRGLRRDDD